jgi:hypothetical protein
MPNRWNMRRPIEASGWTILTVLEYINARIADMELRQQQRFDAQTKAVDAAIIAQRAAVDAALIAANQATAKAETATDIRFQAVNEFRGQLADQATRFITRVEVEAAILRNTERIAELAAKLEHFADKSLVVGEYDQLTTKLDNIGNRVTRFEGKGKGMQASWAIAVALITMIIGIIAVYLAVKG